MNKVLLFLAILSAGIAAIFPESGITIERATFGLVFVLAGIKFNEMLK